LTGRIILLVTSPRLPAGLMSPAAWDAVHAYPVLAAAPSAQSEAVAAAGVDVRISTDPITDLLAAVADEGTVVWLAAPDADEHLTRELGLRLVRQPGLAELELLYGSWDPPGARLLDVVAVLDQLASPGGDPWKQAQTHQSLARFLLEEAYEAYDAIAADQPDALREELGDLLLQVVLHARLAENNPDGQAWTIDDVAGDLVAKLIRRNPHVFGGERLEDLDQITEQWEKIKQAEKGRQSALDGIAWSQPALALAAKVLARASRAGRLVPLPADGGLGSQLLAAVAAAELSGLDAEAALRAAVLEYAQQVRAAEAEG
jgi:XTP/dITP diphosphohydrolase